LTEHTADNQTARIKQFI